MKDNHDIESFIAGNMKSFEKIYNRYMGKTYNYIFTLTHNSDVAKDLTQSTFLQLWNSRRHIDINDNVEGYIFTIARNMLYKEIRSKNIQNNYIEFVKKTSHEDSNMQIEEKISVGMIEEKIRSLLVLLPESRRKIFMMRWNDGLSNKEIAKELCISEKTVSTQIHRTILFLKSKLGPIFTLFLTMYFHQLIK